MTSYEKAKIMKRRAFYESYTDTIRLCPENCCLAQRQPNLKWKLYKDMAVADKHNQIKEVIETWQNGSTAEALADEIGKLFKN